MATAFQRYQETGKYTVNPSLGRFELDTVQHLAVVGGPSYTLHRVWNFSARSEVKTGESVTIGRIVVPGEHPANPMSASAE